jgi:tetraacyldisaccharide 4'-kinase
MTRPGFWFTPPDAPDPRARLLAPLGWLQARMTARRIARGRGWRAPVPVICVGSLDAGNVGVMPAVQALALHLQSRGRSPAILSRATDAAAPLIVDERRHTAADVGDAPLLSAVFATTWIAPDLASGARAITGASAPTADCILLDGGFQDPSLIKDLSRRVFRVRICSFRSGHLPHKRHFGAHGLTSWTPRPSGGVWSRCKPAWIGAMRVFWHLSDSMIRTVSLPS